VAAVAHQCHETVQRYPYGDPQSSTDGCHPEASETNPICPGTGPRSGSSNLVRRAEPKTIRRATRAPKRWCRHPCNATAPIGRQRVRLYFAAAFTLRASAQFLTSRKRGSTAVRSIRLSGRRRRRLTNGRRQSTDRLCQYWEGDQVQVELVEPRRTRNQRPRATIQALHRETTSAASGRPANLAGESHTLPAH
jgi:hypothetical protein